MSELLITDVPEEVLTAIDARAAKLGISRVEYVRRRLAQEVAVSDAAVTVDDLQRFSATFADLDDARVMAEAWDRVRA